MNANVVYDDIHNTGNFDLLEKTIPLFKECFPDPRDIKSLDYIYKTFGQKKANPKVVITIATFKDNPIGFIIGEYYLHSACGLVHYVGKSKHCEIPNYQTYPLHQKVRDNFDAEAEKDGKEVKAILSEVTIPGKEDERYKTIDAERRIKVMARFGAKKIPITYVYPVWEKGKVSYFNDSYLLCYHVRQKFVLDNPEVIKDFLTELYLIEGSKKDNVHLKNMLKELEALE